MSATRLTPDLIRSQRWSFEALFRLAEDCRDPVEADAILRAFYAKKGHEKRILEMMARGWKMLEIHLAAVEREQRAG